MESEIVQPKLYYKTSEFWVTLCSFFISGLYLINIIGTETKYTLYGISEHVIQSIALLIGQSVICIKYINSRKKAKEEVKPKPEIPIDCPKEPEVIVKPVSVPRKKKKNDSKRDLRTNKDEIKPTNPRNKRSPRRDKET